MPAKLLRVFIRGDNSIMVIFSGKLVGRQKFKFNHVVVLCAALLLVFLNACEYTPSAEKPQLVASPDTVSLQLADAADRASRALETLAAVEKSRNPGEGVLGVPNAPQELRRSVTVSWVGPVEPIAQDIASRAGYDFNVLGDEPPTPIVVNLSASNKQVIDVLRDLGLQMGMRADIKVDAARRMVELHYAPLVNINQGG